MQQPARFTLGSSTATQNFATMAPKKRARTAAAAATASSSSQPAAAAPKLTLSGGVPHHPSLAVLWRDERLTDFVLCTEDVEFKAHRVALASSSKYFLNLFESGLRDAADTTHALGCGFRSRYRGRGVYREQTPRMRGGQFGHASGRGF